MILLKIIRTRVLLIFYFISFWSGDATWIKCCIFSYPIPSNMGHFDALTWQDLHAILEPLSCDLIIRHLALEHGLVGRLDC